MSAALEILLIAVVTAVAAPFPGPSWCCGVSRW